MSEILWAESALLPSGWAGPVRLGMSGGRIDAISEPAPDTPPEPGAHRVDILLPAPGNLHSHAFQRAMAGRTERRGAGPDSFWTWRRLMYDFLGRLRPEHVEAIAAQVYVEMLEAGFGAVGEFHYLHHQPDGTPYHAPAEMAHRVTRAADRAGIAITLLPVLYSQGGADGRALAGAQRRFGTDLAGFTRLVEDAARAGPDILGVAPHSLRAVAPGALAEVSELRPEAPIHMHIAEQVAEVEEILAVLGARPVAWALDRLGLGPRWCLIHATQMTPDETAGLAASGAVAGLCPLTEANLGDGIFDGARFLAGGGRIGIGSDSTIRVTLTGELCQLEYSQRLRDRARAVLADPGGSVGRRLLEGAAAGAGLALGRGAGRLEVGAPADLLGLDGGALCLAGTCRDTALDAWIFAGDERAVRDVWSAGRHVVSEGRHRERDAIARDYRRAIADLVGS